MTRVTIEERLCAPEDEVRYRAVSDLASLDDSERARELLIGCLGDASWRVRKAAGEQLLSLAESRSTVTRLLEALADDDNAGMRNAAAEVLVRTGAPAVNSLVGAIQDEDSDVRKLIVDVLGDIGEVSATSALVGRLRDDDENVRGAAAEALGKIGGSGAEAALMGMLGRKDLLSTLSALDALARAGTMVPIARLRPLLSKRLLRRPALTLLARLSAEEALAKILDALEDPSRGTREAALAALARWTDAHDAGCNRIDAAVAARDPAAIEAAARSGLASDDVWVRAAALDLMALVGSGEAAPSIVQAAGDERLRERALNALRRLGPAAVEPLIRELERLPGWAQSLALEALSFCASERSVPSIVPFLEHHDEDVRLAAVETLARLGHPSVVEPLARLLGWADGLLAGAIVRALSEVAKSCREPVLEACRRRLEDDDAKRVADACRVLSAVGSPAEIPLLRAVLRREDARAREAAAEALGSLRCGDAIVQLRYALADESPSVRAAAARALGRHGGKEATDVLLVALGDEEPTVVGAAAEAIGEMGEASLGRHLLPLLGDSGAPGAAPAAYAAVVVLARLGAPELDQALWRAAAHPEGEVAKGAVVVANRMSEEVANQILLACARHRQWDVRYSAAKALASRDDASLVAELRLLARDEKDEMVAEALNAALGELEEKVG